MGIAAPWWLIDTTRGSSRAWTVERWLDHWLENIAKPSVRYKTYVGYRTAVYKHLIPGIGAHRLHRLEPEHLETLYARMQANGLKAGTAHQVHRTARTAFGEAFKRRRITRNPADLAKPPPVDEEEIEPFEAEEIDRLLSLALAKRNGVRFVVALALGIRQGEALGLKWSRLDGVTKTLRIRGAATADVAAWVRRPACMRCPLSQGKTVQAELQKAPTHMPTPVPGRLYKSCPMVPTTTRRRPGRGGSQIESRTP